MSDIDYGPGHWHVGKDGKFEIYAQGKTQVVQLQMTPKMMIGLAADLSSAAWSMLNGDDDSFSEKEYRHFLSSEIQAGLPKAR